jgi:hypothetical protein
MIIVIRLADFQMHLLLQHKGQRLGGGGGKGSGFGGKLEVRGSFHLPHLLGG